MKYFKKHWIPILVIGAFVVWTAAPIVLMLQQSVKPTLLMFSDPPQFFFQPTAEHFIKIFTKNNIMHNMINSMIVGFSTTILCLAMGSMCSYSLARLHIPGKKLWAFFILLTRMVPVGALMMPLYVLMRKIGLANSYLAIIIAHTTLNLPFTIWMLKGFFEEIPLELEQAAQVDGCTKLKTFFKVSLPLAAPGLVATGILTLLNSWNEFMFALTLSGRATRTLPVGISSFVGSVSIDWGGSSAAAALASVPIFIAGVFIQKYLVRGMTAGAVKG